MTFEEAMEEVRVEMGARMNRTNHCDDFGVYLREKAMHEIWQAQRVAAIRKEYDK